ncbi:MAG TPA: sigma-70 family RNA polymerase sigma factor [Rhizomicrobium sp.]|jgi:RNA polymerase sigma-70 factor (ECF subfamily)
MSENDKYVLRKVFLNSYSDLVKTITKRLGSRERAEDALHDAYIRLERNGEVSAQSPRAYLVRMALNIATDTWRAENHPKRIPGVPQESRSILTAMGRDAALNAIDENPDAERVAVARSDLRRLNAILAELPARRRAIFEAIWLEGATPEQAADRFDLALRTIQQELKLAREHCFARFREKS